ncbi:ABC transporter substrate-binding protein [Halopiger goleimassiliensis]|uniref:ABC transporter substrate-binding protein n=1 Tax=Halopiger goleimassiliensis TaxID=1293048 RepID=UPI0006780C80|nr:ABC transporter substrate-binding protein [Halopiger goleimassiliensis]
MGDESDDEAVDVSAALERNDVEYGNIQEGGRLEFAIPRNSISDYDQAQSTAAEDSVVFEAVYDGLITVSSDGEYLPWMAVEHEATEANDVDVLDYEEYMVEMEAVDAEDGYPFFELEDENNLVMMRHPEDMPAEAGDTVRVLTREEAGDAVDDGVFGTMVEGRLHEGIEFHNGEELTAENVLGSYDRYVGSDNEGQLFDSFLHAEAPDGPDGYTYELYSQLPDAAAFVEIPPFLLYPSDHFDVPAGDLDPRDDEEMVPIGTGPYEVADFEEGSRLLLERTDTYWVEEVGLDNIPWWDGPDEFPEGPVIDEINIRFVDESVQRSAALEDGDVDIAYELPSDARNSFYDSDNYVVSATEAFGFLFMQFPVAETETGGAFAEREIRQAVNALVPRQQIVDFVEQGWADPARVPFPEPAADLGTAGDYEDLFDEEWAYPVEPDVERAEQLVEESSLEAPIDVIIRTNSDDDERIDKMQLVVEELNASGLFEAELETPAALGDWTPELYTDGARHDYAEDNAAAVIGLAGTPEPHGYPETIHDPDNWNGCCNFFFPEGTFPEEFIDLLRSCRFATDVAEDEDTRRQRYDELWPELTDLSANTIVDYSLNTGTANDDVVGFNVHPQTQAILSYALYSPTDEQIIYLDR